MLWLNIEGGLMRFCGKGTTTRFVEDAQEKRDKLVRFFVRNIHNKYNIYFAGFVFCELLNLLIVLGTVGLTHRFLHKRYLLYGIQVWQYYLLPEEEQRMPGVTNPLCRTFPRVASCNYWRFGSGGRQENINAICILRLNIINDKVFLVLWWWFALISLLGALRMLYRAVQVQSPGLRYKLLEVRLSRFFRRSGGRESIQSFLLECKVGDWFVLYQLSKNLNRQFFVDFLTAVTRRLAEEGETGQLQEDEDSGDDLMAMLLKPSFTTQESEKGGAGPQEGS